MSGQAFVTLAAPAGYRSLIVGSDFLTYAERADTPEQALGLLARLRELHPDATHHCWAYRIGGQYRFSDDGEPGGTAGAPILRAIEGQGVDHVMVVVVRYYGGTKLGAGGLVRAYSGGAAECLRTAAREEVRPRVTVTVRVPFEHLAALYAQLTDLDAARGEEAYDEHGLVLPLTLLEDDLNAFQVRLRDATRGAAEVEVPGEETSTTDV